MMKHSIKLTNRELEIITLLAKGFLNKEIAQELKISIRTVQAYNTKIYIKLSVANRASAVAKFLRMQNLL